MRTIKRLVIKLGTSTLTHTTGLINIHRFKKLVEVVSKIKNNGIEVVIVSSGAIGLGMGKLGLQDKPTDMSMKQACAAVGQCELMTLYDHSFAAYNHLVSQILLTKDVVENSIQKENFCSTLNKLLELSIIPIINENDSISTEEIEFGDNDTLSAIVATLCKADTLVILSDIDGLYDKDPNIYKTAKIIPVVSEITDEIRSLAGDTIGNHGTGGMITKISAAEICLANAINMSIINGDNPDNLYSVIENKEIGTMFIKRRN